MRTYRIHYLANVVLNDGFGTPVAQLQWHSLKDDQGFPLEFLVRSNACYVARALAGTNNLPAWDDGKNWELMDSTGQVHKITFHNVQPGNFYNSPA